MLPSNSSSPTRTTTEPKIASSTVTCSTTGLPSTRVRASASRTRRWSSGSTALRTSATTRLRRAAAASAHALVTVSRSWPSCSSTSRSARAAVRRPARPSSRSATRARLFSTGRPGLVRAERTCSCCSTMVPRKNSSPSTCSSSPAFSAPVKAAMAARAASRLGKSRNRTRCLVATVASSSTLAWSSGPPPSSVSGARLGSGGSPGSARALRSRTWPTSSRASSSRSASTWSIARWPRAAASSSSSWAWAASAWLTSVAIAVLAPAGQGAGLGLVAELVDVLVDQAQLAVPVERVADHPGGQLDGQGADLVAELADGLVALGPDGLPGPVELPAGFGLGLAAQVPADPLGVGPGLLQDPLGLVLGVAQPPPVLLQQLLGLLAVLLGLFQLPLDVGPAVLERLVDRGEDRPVHEEQQDQERDRAPDELVRGGQDGVLLMLRRLLGQDVGKLHVPSHLLDDERQGEAEQGKGLDQGEADEHERADLAGRLGLTRDALDGLADQEADADARPERAEAVADDRDAAADGLLGGQDVLHHCQAHLGVCSFASARAPRLRRCTRRTGS